MKTTTTTQKTLAELKSLWAKIRNRRSGMWAGLSEVEQAAALLYGPYPRAPEDAAAYADGLCEEWHGPGTYWRQVAAIIRAAR